MNKLYLLLLFVFGVSAFGQQKGISYQAVIINPNEIKAPGYNATGIPLANKAICMSFKVVNNINQVEYQESQSITTDGYGMINVVIGTGNAGAGLVSTLEAVAWNQGNKKLVVGVNIDGVCSNYTEISNQILNYTPYSFYALNADLKDGSVTDAKVATGISPLKVGLGNVNNTSDANKPVSTATQTALNLKEDISNKSTVISLGNSDQLYPTQKAVKAYVDTAVAGATIVDADLITKGKIQLTGDLGGTAGSPTVPGLALKLDASQKGVPNGLATLNSAGIIPSSQLPPVSISSTNVVASQADMLALSNATVGSIAVRTDVNKNYILAVAGPSVLANWIELLTPGAPVQSVNGMTGSVVVTKSNVGLANVDNTSDTAKPISSATQNALNLKLNVNQVGVANGTASLNALGKIPTDQIPAISFSSVKVLNSQADMLALNSAVVGSVVIRTDVNKNYVLAQANPSVQANWIELLTPAPPVQTVNGYTGSISLTNSDIGLANVDNTSDTNKPVSAPQQSALNLKADISSLATVATSGNYNDLTNKPTISLPTASVSVLGGVKIGANLSIDVNGVVSATASNNVSSVTGVLPVANGGTGSATQIFVDLSSNQNGIAGSKSFSDNIVSNGINVGKGVGTQSTLLGASASANDNSTAIGFMSLSNNGGTNNTAVGTNAMRNSSSTSYTTAVGVVAGQNDNTGDNNTFIGYAASVPNNSAISNATAIGSNAVVTASNTIQLGADGTNGSTALQNVKTSGTITAGTVTYPNAHGTANQVLTTTGNGTLTWSAVEAREVTDEFTATASQTSFTLTQTKSVNSKVKMFINGVRISNTAFTISGNILTYIPASNGGYNLTAGNRIQFDYSY